MYPPSPHLRNTKTWKIHLRNLMKFGDLNPYPIVTTQRHLPREIREIFLPKKKINKKHFVDFSPMFFFFLGDSNGNSGYFSLGIHPVSRCFPVFTDTSRSPNVGNFIRPAGFRELQPQKVKFGDLQA